MQAIEPKGTQLKNFWEALAPAIKRLAEKENAQKEQKAV